MKKLLVLLLFPLLALAQSGGGVSNTPPLIGNKGTSLPAACTVGQLFFKSDATAGQNIYECAAANTWTQQLNSGGGGSPGGVGGNLQTNNGAGAFGAYAGATCASGAATAVSASGALTCGSGTIVVPSTVSTTPTTISTGTIAQIRAFDVDTSGAATTINLPATPVDGELIYIKKKTTDNNLLTVGRNAKNIDGAASNLTTNAANKPLYALQWSATDSTWYQVAISPSGTVVSTQSSTTYALAGTDSGLTVQYTGAGAGSLTIPAATTFGTTYTFNLEDRESGASASATLTPGGGSTIDGAASVIIPYGFGIFANSDGANYTTGKYSWKYFPLDTGSAQTVPGQKTFVAPILGAATGTSFNGLTITSSTGTLTVPNGVTLTGPASSGTAMTLGNAEAVAGVKTFSAGTLITAAPTVSADTFANQLAACSGNSGKLYGVNSFGNSTTYWQCDGTYLYPLGGRATLWKNNIPFIYLPTGNMANNGANTLGTPLPQTYAQAYGYLPANAIVAGSSAGWYYTTCSTTSACTHFNNVYTTGNPSIPTSPTAFATTGPGAYTQTTASNIAAFSGTLPANILALQGTFHVQVYAEPQANNANTKAVREFWGATQIGGSFFLSSTTGGDAWWQVSNKGNALKQWNIGSGNPFSTSNGAAAATTIDTTATVAVTVTVNSATATDAIILDGWDVWEQSQ